MKQIQFNEIIEIDDMITCLQQAKKEGYFRFTSILAYGELIGNHNFSQHMERELRIILHK
tara:strand:- start:913 stop:1092 length:180 start_codon:yes stop_codon:yes gene_type:complete